MVQIPVVQIKEIPARIPAAAENVPNKKPTTPYEVIGFCDWVFVKNFLLRYSDETMPPRRL